VMESVRKGRKGEKMGRKWETRETMGDKRR
jgi:hypothetical protein